MANKFDRQQKLALWKSFCDEHKVVERAAPLFVESNNLVQTFTHGQNQRTILKRSPEMEDIVITEANKVIDDYKIGSNNYDGLIYMMFWSEEDIAVPLYIGKTEKIGRKGSLSANIKGIRSTHPFFCRWGYNYEYHLGDLSSVVCPGHDLRNPPKKYVRWAEMLFSSYPSSSPSLNHTTYFWCKAWQSYKPGIWREYGETSLTFLEYLLIGVASDLFPHTVLNTEGVNKRQQE
ncbi:hypothetical protein K2Z83_15210 [Oscillochloris sp. ZM17-4]|uniref:hypothetical protein n=1 Tax=Oscillochloris sp. ZM17-4 TaxID=2866714 RepID=UPI001C730D9A|nr:hypothetical protein [Oscillochloris sp. ZM17-4]MBX0329026.1 hypothetical protein [Oscillochloris sp. ZM17-4]